VRDSYNNCSEDFVMGGLELVGAALAVIVVGLGAWRYITVRT
jgi:hypothetical protein